LLQTPLCLGLTLGFLSTPAKAADLPQTVLVVDSNTQSTPYFVDVHAAFNAAMDSISDKSVYVYTESLDLQHFNDEEYLNRLSEFFREKYDDKPVGVIVTYSALSLSYVLEWRDKTWPGVPVVFVNVDERAVNEFNLPSDVTGLTGRYRLEDMVDVAQALVPNLKRVAIVGGRLGAPGLWEHFAEDVPDVQQHFMVDDLTGLPLSEMKRRVSALSMDTAIIYVPLFTDGDNESFVPKVALQLILETANRPIVVDADVLIGTGAAGGFVTVGNAVGSEAAQLAWRVLRGQDISELPVRNGDFRRPIFDWQQLERWEINSDNLPSGSEIRFRQPTAWEQYRWQIVVIALVLLTQALLIAGLVVERRRRRHAEQKAHHRMAELAHLNRIATAGEMSASIAHEINQPLAAIVTSGNAGLRWLTSQTPNLAEAVSALKRIVSDGFRAGQTIEMVRSMYQKNDEVRAAVDINRLIRDVLALLRVELNDNRVSARTALWDRLPHVWANEVQLQQVIVNLVNNGIEAMRTVTGRERRLRIETGLDTSDHVFITVADSGTGIDPENADRLFDSFFTTKPDGIGLGLSICRSIVESHGGRIWASTGHPNGTVLHVVLPVVEKAGE
jgi:signal transduction histidine kinase